MHGATMKIFQPLLVCIIWTNKEFDIINARCNHEDFSTFVGVHYLD
jgi:hypothetical protein